MKYIYICIISTVFLSINGQDSIQANSKAKYDLHLSIGTDLAAPTFGLFTDRMGYSLLINAQVWKLFFFQSQIGYEQNTYEDIGWKVAIDGSYAKIGANYIISKSVENPNEMFYAGLSFAFSNFNQNLNQVPLRAENQQTIYYSFPNEKANALWLEIPIGARVGVYKKRFFLEAKFSPKVLLSSKGGESAVEPVIIPDFGRDNSNINVFLFWGITYSIK